MPGWNFGRSVRSGNGNADAERYEHSKQSHRRLTVDDIAHGPGALAALLDKALAPYHYGEGVAFINSVYTHQPWEGRRLVKNRIASFE